VFPQLVSDQCTSLTSKAMVFCRGDPHLKQGMDVIME